MHKIKTSAITLFLALAIAISALPTMVPGIQAANPVAETTFSIMQISDTQFLPEKYPQLFSDTTVWIVNNSANYNLKMVVHTGDFIPAVATNPTTPPTYILYNDSQMAQHWAIANDSMSKLLDAGIPYCWAAGNRDQTPLNTPNGTMMGSGYLAFNTSYLRAKPYWVDDFNSKNTAVKFTVNNFPFMLINVEYSAEAAVLAWMKGLLNRNPSCNVIVTAHLYLNENGTYSNSTPALATWINNFKATLDNYPNVFLTLSGHYSGPGSNMSRAGNREEIFFDRSAQNNQTGAAAVRIYAFNLTSKKVNVSTYSLATQAWLTDAYSQFSFDASITSDWTLVNDARTLKAYPNLREYVWLKDARMPPNGQYDKIQFHRLVKTGITPKGVIFIEQGANSGEKMLSNPPSDNWTKEEKYSPGIYWANRGFDVYALDKREYFAQNLNASEMSSVMANWGFAQYISDYKEAINKAKEVSGATKVFFFGFGTGGRTVMNYASLYWREDLKGIILAASDYPSHDPVVAKRGNETNTYNLTRTVESMIANGTGATDFLGISKGRAQYALDNPGGPAEYPPGNPVTPAINPVTNKSWTNITEFATWALALRPGIENLTLILWNIATGFRYTPARLSLEYEAMAGWVNCPYLAYDYDDHWSEINVPLLSFTPGFWSNSSGTLRFINGIGSTDFTPVMLANYGPVDPIYGEYSARDVFAPAYDWMVSHLSSLDVSAFQSVRVLPGWTWWFFEQNAGGNGPYTYQWYEGLNPIQGQTSMVLPISKNTPGVYSFYCRVTDKDGTTTTSNAVTLTVLG